MPFPYESMLCMGISALLAIGVPIALLVVFHRRYARNSCRAESASWFRRICVGFGAAFTCTGTKAAADGRTRDGSPILYMLYGSFAAGIFGRDRSIVSYMRFVESTEESGLRSPMA